jgi:hypothetical protein
MPNSLWSTKNIAPLLMRLQELTPKQLPKIGIVQPATLTCQLQQMLSTRTTRALNTTEFADGVTMGRRTEYSRHGRCLFFALWAPDVTDSLNPQHTHTCAQHVVRVTSAMRKSQKKNFSKHKAQSTNDDDDDNNEMMMM